MPKALRLFLHDNIKLTVSTNVPGTPIDTRTIKVQGTNINVIDLSKRTDILAVELTLRVKDGQKYDPPILPLPTKDSKDFIQEKTDTESLSFVQKFIENCKRPFNR